MRLVLIADTFPPIRTSGAVQLKDLAREFARQDHTLTVLLPSADLKEPWLLERLEGIEILRLRSPRFKDVSYMRRTLAELVMPFAMMRNFRKSPLVEKRWDGLIWYSPSIFHGPFVSVLKKSSNCKSYLIIRDLFPDWAVDMGLMGRGLIYRFFDAIARYQYSVADVIGVQASGNQKYFNQWLERSGRKLEVLPNWLDRAPNSTCSIRVNNTALMGRKVFVYAGNIGVAQGMEILLDLAEKIRNRSDIGFLIVGRGSDTLRLKESAQSRHLDNILFFDEIDPDEIPDLYAQCHAGIVLLDHRHKSHNIPGKFVTYIRSGLPVLASVNEGNELAHMIRDAQVGQVCETNNAYELMQLTEKLLDQIVTDLALSARCKDLFNQKFAVEKTVKQIVAALCKR
jgi:glycosyltransferase involved in cell wall biosynthesis